MFDGGTIAAGTGGLLVFALFANRAATFDWLNLLVEAQLVTRGHFTLWRPACVEPPFAQPFSTQPPLQNVLDKAPRQANSIACLAPCSKFGA